MSSILNFCKYLKEKDYPQDSILLKEGERLGILYILKHGSIEIQKNGLQITTVSKPGAIFGEMSVLLDIPHTATVKTAAESKLYTIENANEFLKTHKEITYHLATMLAERLQIATNYLIDLKKQLEHNVDSVDVVFENLIK
ncbi:MAG: cyclic nucleotide-binding domain-containing protein [Thermodesulfobacteriota bacterium]